MSNFKSKPTSIAKVYVWWGRIADSSRHPQPRPSLHQVWCIIRASMLKPRPNSCFQECPHCTSESNPEFATMLFQPLGEGGWGVKPSAGDSKYLGKVHRFYSSLIWQRKSPFLQNLLWMYGSPRTADVFYLSSLLSLRKTHFCGEATTRNTSAVHRLDINGKMFCLFFLAADQVTLLE